MYKNNAARYTLFGLLYFSQGTVLGYFTALNALYLLSKGISMTNVGIFALIAMIPFVLKIFLGMLSDNVNLLGLGHRKPYILLGLAIQIACLIAAPLIDPAQYYWGFVALAFVLQLGMALYDTCTDGLALDTTPEEEQSTIQGFMVGGRALGVIIAASAAGLLAEISWPAVFWSLAGLSLLPIPLVWGVREAARPVERAFEWGAFRAFRQRRVLAVTGLGFVFFIIIAGANQNVNPFFEQAFGIELSTAGLLATVWGIGVVLGGTVGATLMRWIGHRVAIWAALALSVGSLVGLALTPSVAWTWPLDLLFGLSYGTYQTLYYALSMGCTDKRIAASMYSILMAACNVAQGVGMALSGALADGIDFRWTFVALAGLNVLALPLIPALSGKRAQPCEGCEPSQG
ncbi:MAG: MFS transporter [Anaerolineae bacterium]|nr:MFS transporter [Anaerolineae bacterium]